MSEERYISDERDITDVSLEVNDLHEIIHGLTIASFTFLEPDAADAIQQLIKQLPSPESLPSLASRDDSVTAVKDQIGEIMQILNHYGMKGPEFKARYMSKKKLPPRHPVVDYQNVNYMENAASTVESLIKVSESADNKGNVKIAVDMLSYARKKTLTHDDVCNIQKDLEKFGLTEEIELLREAGLWDKIKSIPENMRTNSMEKALQTALTNLNEFGLQIEQWLRKYPDNEKLREIYNKMSQMTYVGKEVFNLFDEDLEKNIQPGEGFVDDTQTLNVQDMDIERAREKAYPPEPKQIDNNLEEDLEDDNESWEIQQSLVQGGEQTVNDVVNFLMDENNAVRFLNSIGDIKLKDAIRNSPSGRTISQKILSWLSSFSNPEQAIVTLQQNNPILNQIY